MIYLQYLYIYITSQKTSASKTPKNWTSLSLKKMRSLVNLPPRLQPDLTKLHVLTRPLGDDGTVGDGWWLVVGG